MKKLHHGSPPKKIRLTKSDKARLTKSDKARLAKQFAEHIEKLQAQIRESYRRQGIH